jgi:hypothetical protein
LRKAEKAAQKAETENTFEAIAHEWHDAQKHRWTEEHAGRVIRLLERDIFQALGRRPIAEIEPPELLGVLRHIETRGALDICKRQRKHCGQIFRYAVASGRASRDPTADLRGGRRVVQADRAWRPRAG